MFSLLIVVAVITLVFDAQTVPLIDSDRLPGLDEIESGFDVVAMFSTSDKNSKFRIFDLNENGRYPFKLDVAGKVRIYNTPHNTQVTKVGLRREVNCEDISTSFSQFYSYYFRSTRGGSGWSFLGFGQSSRTHQTVKKIYDSMTKNAQAVGTSTSWWGLYSIQLGPPYIIKLDPFFNASMTDLASRPTPTTESEQTPYNVLVETYGTHYPTHVIVGATARVFTSVNEAYFKSSTFEEVRTQVFKMGTYWFYSDYDMEESHSLYQSMTETFRKNTNSFAEYQPPAAQVIGKTEWQSWLVNAPQQPVVVNRTLAPLTNLFYAYPRVQAHLRRTIDYYLSKGSLPTFAQLQR